MRLFLAASSNSFSYCSLRSFTNSIVFAKFVLLSACFSRLRSFSLFTHARYSFASCSLNFAFSFEPGRNVPCIACFTFKASFCRNQSTFALSLFSAPSSGPSCCNSGEPIVSCYCTIYGTVLKVLRVDVSRAWFTWVSTECAIWWCALHRGAK